MSSKDHRKPGRLLRLAAAVVALAFVAAACGDDSTSANESTGATGQSATGASATTTTVAPKAGGTLTFGVFSEAASLDPTLGAGTGSVGAIEQTAIYDLLVTYDYKTGTYVPRVAKSLTPNADSSEWTLVLRPGITFGDGTAYDAEAVKFNIERHKAPESKSTFKGIITDNIASMTVVDPLTLTIKLTSPWGGFPVLLASGPGRIASPTAIKALGATFATNPVGAGAGPFSIGSFAPKESIVLKKNPKYWGGDVYLDSLKFVPLSNGSAGVLQTLQAGGINGGFLQDPKVNQQAKAAGYTGFETAIGSTLALVMNAAKAPFNDPAVRKAIVQAIDPKVVNDRVYDGAATASSSPFPPGFLWDPKVAGTSYDAAAAKAAVTAAKAKGWDGKIKLTVQSTPTGQALGTAVESMLKAAGIDVTVDGTKDTAAVVNQVLVNKDYELAQWGLTFTADDLLYSNMAQNLTGRYGYSSDAMTAGLTALRKASTNDQKVAAVKTIAETWAADNPVASLAHFTALVTFDKTVHGVTDSVATTVFFDKAWIG
jgi:peptide/nickel transport system substrate-binding protein